MLLDIAKVPTAENSTILLHPDDNVAIARVPIPPGTGLRPGAAVLTTLDPIPAGHKVAIRPIARGAIVLRYGQAIGRAAADIAPGAHVHTHNLSYEELEMHYEFPATEAPIPAP